MNALNVLIVDDELNIRKTLALCLECEGHKVVAVSNSEDAVVEVSRRPFDLAFVDLRLGTSDGLDLIPALLASSPWLKIIVITPTLPLKRPSKPCAEGQRTISPSLSHRPRLSLPWGRSW